MDLDNLLGGLVESAYDKLKKIGESQTEGNWITIIIDESLGDGFSFSLKEGDNKYSWTRMQWRKQSDVEKAVHPIQQLKYLGLKMLPDILTQNGSTSLEEAKTIFEYATSNNELTKSLPCSDILVHGTTHTLRIFVNGKLKEYTWNLLPKNWAPLATLVNMLLDLNNKVA